MLKLRLHRGDTLIEVMLAMSVFSLVLVGTMTLMNQGAASARRALETTLVRQQIDGQAETLRFMHDAYVAAYQTGATYTPTTPAGQWAAMIADIPIDRQASSFGTGATCPSFPSGSFVIDTTNVTYIAPNKDKLKIAPTFAQLTYEQLSGAPVLKESQGLWIEAVRSRTNTVDLAQANTGYIDFHIRACWDAIGQSLPMTVGTIVRLYEPRG